MSMGDGSAVLKIGVFEVQEVTEGRWSVRNTLTDVSHVTYGTEEEVREQLEKQSGQWRTRLEKNPAILRAQGWRGSNHLGDKK